MKDRLEISLQFTYIGFVNSQRVPEICPFSITSTRLYEYKPPRPRFIALCTEESGRSESYLPQSNLDVRSKGRYTSTSPCVHDVHKDKFTFNFTFLSHAIRIVTIRLCPCRTAFPLFPYFPHFPHSPQHN